MVKYCVFGADEAPPEGLVAAVGVGYGKTYVEELTVVVDVRVVAVAAAFAAEGVADVEADGGGVAGEGKELGRRLAGDDLRKIWCDKVVSGAQFAFVAI